MILPNQIQLDMFVIGVQCLYHYVYTYESAHTNIEQDELTYLKSNDHICIRNSIYLQMVLKQTSNSTFMSTWYLTY